MKRVTDVLVKANTLANASVEQFSMAITTKAGPAARVVGMEIEELTAMLAAFADQGVKGSEAGTAVNIVLRDLQTAVRKNSDEFKKHGIAVYDANGEMRNIAKIIKDIEVALEGMSDETKKTTLAQLGFADRSMIFIQTLLGTSQKITKYERELKKAGGTTKDVADKQMTPFQKMTAEMGASLTELSSVMVNKLNPSMLAFAAILKDMPEGVRKTGNWFNILQLQVMKLHRATQVPFLWLEGSKDAQREHMKALDESIRKMEEFISPRKKRKRRILKEKPTPELAGPDAWERALPGPGLLPELSVDYWDVILKNPFKSVTKDQKEWAENLKESLKTVREQFAETKAKLGEALELKIIDPLQFAMGMKKAWADLDAALGGPKQKFKEMAAEIERMQAGTSREIWLLEKMHERGEIDFVTLVKKTQQLQKFNKLREDERKKEEVQQSIKFMTQEMMTPMEKLKEWMQKMKELREGGLPEEILKRALAKKREEIIGEKPEPAITGRMGFAEYGQRIQDALMQRDDPAKKTAINTAKQLEVLKINFPIMIEEIKKIQPGLT